MKRIFYVFLGLLCSLSSNSQPIGPYQLPDKQAFPVWDNLTDYQKVYHVSQNHPEATDQNPGTEALPFKTISRAAQVLEPGQKVIIHAGTYREQITPRSGGTSEAKMIGYESAAGEKVTVKGSKEIMVVWEPSLEPAGQPFSLKLWQCTLPDQLFNGEINPFETQNASPEDIDLMPWAHHWKGRIPYSLSRGLVFQNGRRMVELAIYEDLVHIPGSFWIDSTRDLLHVHPFEGVDPNLEQMEVTVYQHLFKPKEVGTSFIHLKGINFEHAGNGFPRVGVGAIFVNGGHHWIIQNNTVKHVNSVGIEIGARVNESSEATSAENERVRQHPGGFIVRNNYVYDCGTGGIEGHNVKNTLLEENTIEKIGWQDVERYWECAGVKLLVNENTLLIRNHIFDVEAASGIWLDWNNKNCRITRNIIHDIGPTFSGAVYVEASRIPNLVDNNVIWNVKGAGVTLNDTDQCNVVYNLIAKTDQPVVSKVNTDRSLNGIPLSSKNNQVSHNIFYQNRKLPLMESNENQFDRNFWASLNPEVKLEQWRKKGWGAQSQEIEMVIWLDHNNKDMTINHSKPLPKLKALDFPAEDFGGNPRNENTTAGPFDIKMSGGYQLSLTKPD